MSITNRIHSLAREHTAMSDTIKALISVLYPFCKINSRQCNILDPISSLTMIAESKKSLCRFGEGEMKIMRGGEIGFQRKDEKLAERLRSILMQPCDDVLIGLPGALVKVDANMQRDARLFWKSNVVINSHFWKKYIHNDVVYYDATLTRPWIDYQKAEYAERIFDIYKNKIFVDKKITIIEGEETHFGEGNDLLSSALEIKKILCPAKDAFSNYKEILNKTKTISKENLILIALGPTATVLASDLGIAGYHAIDIGHLDVEYEWYLDRAKTKERLTSKFVNEARE